MSPFDALIYLLAAVIAVPIAKRCGLGSVLGYLLAGVAIGPSGLNLTGESGGEVMHFAEFGVVIMLFLVGLELKPSLLWEMRFFILGLGTAQVLGTAAAGALVAHALGVPWAPAWAIGLILSMSSTAIVLQSLAEKRQLGTPGGQASFAVLLTQDLAVIPILAVFPLLATLPRLGEAPGGSRLAGQPAWERGLLIVAAVAAVIVVGRFLLRPVLRYIAATGLREMFTATALLLVIGTAFLMEQCGLSPALGTFLAGVLLAESEYRPQLETDLEPFKGLLLGLFFISVGAGIDFGLLRERPGQIALLVVGLLVLKFIVLYLLGRGARLGSSQSLLFAFALAQGGEFAFVLASFGETNGVFSPELARLMVITVALSMAAAPILFIINNRLVQPRFQARKKVARPPDQIVEHDNPVLLAGFGRFGHIVGRLLRANGFPTTVLDHDPEQVDTLLKFGLKSYYGDALRLDLLHTAGADKAKLFIVAIDGEEQSLALVRLVKENFPHLSIFARAVTRQHAYELYREGVTHVYRETLGSSIDLSIDALQSLGLPAELAQRAAAIFREHEETAVRALAAIVGDEEKYISEARKHLENLEDALESDRKAFASATAPQAEPAGPAN